MEERKTGGSGDYRNSGWYNRETIDALNRQLANYDTDYGALKRQAEAEYAPTYALEQDALDARLAQQTTEAQNQQAAATLLHTAAPKPATPAPTVTPAPAVTPAPTAAPVPPQPEVQPAAQPETWTCTCGQVNTGKFCQACGKEKPARWFCPNCGQVNFGKFCIACGTPTPLAPETPAAPQAEEPAPEKPHVDPGKISGISQM